MRGEGVVESAPPPHENYDQKQPMRNRVKSYKSIIKTKIKQHDNIGLLVTNKLNTIEVLISKSLIDLYISHNEFILVNHAKKECNEMKGEIKDPKNVVEYTM